MDNHTPGPWAWRGQPGKATLESAQGKVLDYAGYEGMWPGAYDDAVNQANMRLIAAAPELLTAVRGLLEWHAHYLSETDNHVVQVCRAALASATGEQP